MGKDMGASLRDRAASPSDLSPSGSSRSSIPCAEDFAGWPGPQKCACGDDYPMYGVAPHECYWRKGPEYTLGQSTLTPFGPDDCFVPDLEEGETWADFRYPGACGTFYCPDCQQDKYRARWDALIARIGPPPPAIGTAAPSGEGNGHV